MPQIPYEFKRSQFLPLTIDKAWNFFSNPRNLVRITPAALGFRIVSEVPAKIYEGLTVEYRVKPLFGIPLKWISLIKEVREPYQFADEQIKGPYAYWHHLHTFKEVDGGVMMEDVIHYRVPLQQFLPWINDLIVINDLHKIFEFRRQTLLILFGDKVS